MGTVEDRVVSLVRKAGVLRPRDLDEHGIARTYLQRLHAKGVLERPSRGLYVLAEGDATEHQSLAEACKRVPKGVVCLISALRFHDIGTQNPFEVWMAVDTKARRPNVSYPPLRIMRFSGKALTEGVERHHLGGVVIRVYSPAKTVADCFKYRNKIGLDVAMEALKETIRSRRATNDDLWRFAGICRVQNVMRPYLEAMVA